MGAAAIRYDWRLIGLVAAGAVALRLLLFLGRGDYVAFDEGWYLLLGRSVYGGTGYSLIGIPHVTLSPLFPLLAGAAGVVVDNWVWGGRILAAVASGIIVLPAWALFRRLAPERTAFIAVLLIAVMPSMAPFVAAYWVGADLWVGAEPLLHLLLYTGLALWLRAHDTDRLPAWALAGAAFALAYLARPEAILAFGFLGLAALGLAAWSRSPRRLAGAVLMALTFAVTAAPYWVYLRDVTGVWTLSGRVVAAPSLPGTSAGGDTRADAATTIERMLWEDDKAYEQYLYGLDPSGLRLRADYWGIYPEATVPADAAADRPETGRPAVLPPQRAAAQPPAGAGATPEAPSAPDATREQRVAEPPSPLVRYFRALGIILPLLLWPFVILGAAQPRGRAVLRRELPVTVSLVGTSLAIAFLVAADPRTQLFLVPLLALYAARGFSLVEQEVQRRAGAGPLRPGFVELMLATVAVVWLLGIDGRRLYLSLALGSPHHTVAEQNREVAEEIEALFPERAGPVMSWHPAIAVFADRDWRPLPHAGLPAIIRYAGASGTDVIVLSAYYPPDLGVEDLNTRYLLMGVPPAAVEPRQWNLRFEHVDSLRATGEIEPAP